MLRKKKDSKVFNLNVSTSVTMEQYAASFKTADNTTHQTEKYDYLNVNAIRCLPQEFMFGEVQRKGFLVDDRGIFYPLTSVISIKFQKLESVDVTIPPNSARYNDVFYTEAEVMSWERSVKK